MNLLVDNNITPHVFTLTSSSDKEIPLYKVNQILQDELIYMFNQNVKYMFNQNVKYIYPLITETSDSTKEIIKLYDFLIKIINMRHKYTEIIFLVILFQIMYTLLVFNKVGLKHNDLHLKNIFIQINSANILSNNHDIYFNKYVVNNKGINKDYLIPNIGIDVRIYDFDRSCKFNNNIYPHFGFIQSTYIPELKSVNVNCLENPSFDTFKLLGEIHNLLKKNILQNNQNILINKLKDIIESFFYDTTLLNLDTDSSIYSDINTNITYKDIIRKGRRYYLIDKKIPETIMVNTYNIVNTLGVMIRTSIGYLSNIEIFEEFSMNNIK